MRSLALLLLLTNASFPATYKGKNIDGNPFPCAVKTASEILSASCTFEGRFVTVKANKLIYSDLKLAWEDIDNPKEIIAYMGKDVWVLDVELRIDSR